MKISYNWLKEYIDIDISIDDLAQKITDSGIEVEEIIPLLPNLDNIVLGQVKQKEKHPNADKLSICIVMTGNEEFQVICGAPNVEAGQKVVFAKPGSQLPNGMKIKKAKIRGVESFGMICSKEELGLENKSAGIWILENDLELGTDINSVLRDYKDYIMDLFITSNRPDCLSHTGIAREIAAFTEKQVKWPESIFQESENDKTNNQIKVTIEYPQGCPRYAARLIKNVKIGPSPEWLIRKLEAIGSRSINNVVDITNFVLNELGHPLHAFDYDKIFDHHIIVKKSKSGDRFTTLDDKERKLDEKTVMIFDGAGAVAIGGIMGGQNSEVSEMTTNILLESAYFDPEHILLSSRNLGLVTDASQRFEKGADYENVINALNRATSLIQQLAGGTVTKGIVDNYPENKISKEIQFDYKQVNRILGSNLQQDAIIKALSRLELNVNNGVVSIPSHRVDLKEEIDLIEEVARIINLDNLPTSTVEPVYIEQIPKNDDSYLSDLRECLIRIGLQEIYSNSMLSSKSVKYFPEHLQILNPISDDLSIMRPTLIPGMLNCIKYNINRNNTDLSLFEIGRIFKKSEKAELPDQPYSIAIALSGRSQPLHWQSKQRTVDFFDMKGILEDLFETLHITDFEFGALNSSPIYNEEFYTAIKVNELVLGYCGKISDKIADEFAIPDDVYITELDFKSLLAHVNFDKKYKNIIKFPYIEKDLAIIIKNSIESKKISKFISSVSGKLLRNIDIFDVYSGEHIGEGLKSIAYRLRFQSPDRTLEDHEVDIVFRKIIKACEKEFNAKLREN